MLTQLLLTTALACLQSSTPDAPFQERSSLGGEAFLQADSVDFVVADPTGERIVSCASGGEVVLWDAATGAALARHETGMQRAVEIAFWGSDKLLLGDITDHIVLLGINEEGLVRLDPFEHGIGDLVDLGGNFALAPDEQQLVVWKMTGHNKSLMIAELGAETNGRPKRKAIEVSEFRVDQVVWRADSEEFVVVATNSLKALGRAGTQEQAAGRVHLMNRAGEEQAHFDSPEHFLLSFAYGPHDGDDGIFVAGTREGVHLFDRLDGRHIMRVGELELVVTLDTSHAGTRLVASDSAGHLESWQLSLDASPKALFAERLARPLTVLRVDESEHAVGSQGRRVRRYAVEGFVPDPMVVGHSGQLVALEAHGERVMSVGMDGSVALRSLAQGSAVGFDALHDGIVFGGSLSPSGQLVATCGQDGKLRVWSAVQGEGFGGLVAQFSGRTDAAFTDVAFSPAGDMLAGVTADGILWVWDVESGALVRTFEGLRGLQFKLRFSGDGSHLAVAGAGLRVWRTTDWELGGHVENFGAPVTVLSYGSDPARVAVGLANCQVVLVDADAGVELGRSEPLLGRVSALTFTQSGLAASSAMEGGVRLLDDDLKAGRLLAYPAKSAVAALCTAGASLIVGDGTGRLDVWR